MRNLRALAACGAAVLLLGLLAGAAWAEEPGEESEPRLILPGDHVVHAGEVIRLRWDEADAIRELEILLSLDGGLHYSVCISPQLDPSRHEFAWRVPEAASGALRMRIRFNRDGREIEGAPSAPLVVADANGEPQPLGLPPGGGAVPVPRHDGRGSSGGDAAFEAEDGDDPSGEPSVQSDHDITIVAAVARAVRALTVHSFIPARSFPLRA